jgi:hypothetical protein
MKTHNRIGLVSLGCAAAVLSLCALSCSSASDGGTTSGGDAGSPGANGADGATPTGDGATTCASLQFHVDTFSEGMKKTGAAGLFTFVIAAADPSPPDDPQYNTWTIQVLDPSGAAVTDATVSLPNSDPPLGWSFQKNPWMPTMNHGSSAANTITNNGDGTASVKIYFSMSGLWQTFVVAQSGSMTDSALFSFCLP